MKIAFIGHGHVGGALAANLAKAHHDVTIGVRNVTDDVVRTRDELGSNIKLSSIPDAVEQAEVVFLAVPYSANQAIAESCKGIKGKIIVDCTNPVGPGLSHGLESKTSGGETVQKLFKDCHVVKAFTIYGFENFIDSRYEGFGNLRPAMLIAGNDVAAKGKVSFLVQQLGFEPVDTGDISMSLHLEHLTLLWIKMARAQGKGPNFTWARLVR